jgi:hypothetical protein
MSDMDVVEAFLNQEPAEGASVATDGERLWVNSEVIAEWFEAGMMVTLAKQGRLHERLKDRLVHSILLRMGGEPPAGACRAMMVNIGASQRVQTVAEPV